MWGCETNIWITLAEMLIGIGTFGAILLGIQEYRKAQKWQKAQILLSLIESFENNKQIKLACQMLDWDERDIIIHDDRQITVGNETLINALRVVSQDTSQEFTPEEAAIRDAFDAFFDFFHKLYAFRKIGLLDLSDYTYFYYWFEILRVINDWKVDCRMKETFDNYICKYKFIGIYSLLKEYSKNPQPFEDFFYEKSS